MSAAGRALAGLLLLATCAGCGPGQSARAQDGVGAAPPPPAAAAPVPAPTPSPGPTFGLLDSTSATLADLRTEQGRRPVQVAVPGGGRPAPVQARTTDPVSGGFDLPESAGEVAWWASGAAPGSGSGSVVLAAHVSYRGETGPFTRLAQVAPGARVEVTSADGRTSAYAVVSVRNAPKASLDRIELFRSTGPAALVLVTCGGAYDPETHSYAENVVVTAQPV